MENPAFIDWENGLLKINPHGLTDKKRVVIGRRSDCDLVAVAETVSSRHCVLEIGSRVYVRDCDSFNGTFVNGRLIGKRGDEWPLTRERTGYELRDGDTLHLGPSVCLKCSIESAEGAPPSVRRDNCDCAKTVIDYSGVRCEECGRLLLPHGKGGKKLCPACVDENGEQIWEKVLGRIPIAPPSLPKPQDDRKPVLDGYASLKCLGRGGMGIVWTVSRKTDNQAFALKTFRPGRDYQPEEELKKRFLREGKVSELLNHKNVVKVHRTGCAEDGILFILMELCGGGDVEQLIREQGPLSLESATYLMLQILDGLNYIHHSDAPSIVTARTGEVMEEWTNGIVHRDIKPKNIFLKFKSASDREKPQAVVGDLGLAKTYRTAGRTLMTPDGTRLGSPDFSSRQQAKESKGVKPEADVWAAAATYYYMLTGQNPKNIRPDNQGRWSEASWNEAAEKTALPIGFYKPDLPAPLREVIDFALTDNPQIGFSSALELRQHLISALPSYALEHCAELLT